jgi:hypothetical protein
MADQYLYGCLRALEEALRGSVDAAGDRAGLRGSGSSQPGSAVTPIRVDPLTIRRLVFLAYAAVVLLSLWAVLATRFSDDATILERWTAEGGLFENATVAALFALATGCWLAGWRCAIGSKQRLALFVIGAIILAGAMEEMSWGQRLLGFETPEALNRLNDQGEFNLHNVLDSEIFAALVHTPVYIFFIYLPLLATLFPRGLDRPGVRILRPLCFPDVHNILIFCFGTGLHAWLVPVTIGDSIACCVALVLCAIALWRCSGFRQKGAVAHWLAMAGATVVFAASYEIFRYDNMQYEIRELVVVLGVAYWLTLWCARMVETYSKTTMSR